MAAPTGKAKARSDNGSSDNGGSNKASKYECDAQIERNYVWEGEFDFTRSGLEREQLVKSRSGKIVSKKQSAKGKSILGPWLAAVASAREAGAKGTLKKGSALYNKAKAFYKK